MFLSSLLLLLSPYLLASVNAIYEKSKLSVIAHRARGIVSIATTVARMVFYSVVLRGWRGGLCL